MQPPLQRLKIGFIRSFMLTFGVLSSVFDYLTFGALLYLLHANTDRSVSSGSIATAAHLRPRSIPRDPARRLGESRPQVHSCRS